MSKTVQETPTPAQLDPDVAPDALGDPSAGPSVDVFGRVWRLFISMRFGLSLILGLGVLSLIGTVLLQAPTAILDDPEAYKAWVDEIATRKVGGWAPILSALGMFHVFSSLIFKLLAAMLVTSILACSTNRAPKLWRQATRPRTAMGEAFFDYAALRGDATIDAPPADALAHVRKVLKAKRYRIVDVAPADGVEQLYADRFRWGPFGTVMAHLSFVLITVGVFLTANMGFRNERFVVPVGETKKVGHGTGLEVTAKSFSSEYYPDGRPKTYSSDLILTRHGDQITRKTIKVNDPLRYEGISFYQSFYGVAESIMVTDDKGKVVFEGSVPLDMGSDDEKYSVGKFVLKDLDLVGFAVTPASGRVDPQIKPGQMQVEIYRTGEETPIGVEIVSQGRPAKIAGLDIMFQRTRQFTGLIVAKDPGVNFVWAGSTFLVLGLIIVFYFPHRRMWIRVTGDGTTSRIRVAAPLRRDAGFRTSFQHIINELSRSGDKAEPSGKQDKT